MKIKKLLLLVFTIFFFVFGFKLALGEDDKLDAKRKEIEELERKIADLKGEQKTLSSAINYLDSKIKLTFAQISQTEEEINVLEGQIDDLLAKINVLDVTITDVSAILSNRIEATYKREAIKPFYLFLSSQGFSDFFTKVKYLKIVQQHDRELLYQMQESKMNYDEQKKLKEKKQVELEALQTQLKAQKLVLDNQKQEKAVLLSKTKSDEKRYQEMLAAARAEMEALQSIIAGMGKETKVGEIKEGDRIASVIVGRSACSSGTHLHFEVAKDGAHHNPAGFLKNISIIWDNSPDGSFGFSGSWNWPINEPVRVTQGYGITYWSKLGWYGGGPHTGIDIVSDSSNSIKAVKEGTLYRGSIACGGGVMRYVKVEHKDNSIETYYVHVNY
jgi:peptidoglycan hydrolase CwlO-like protein